MSDEATRNTFRKSERLSSKNIIEELFNNGSSFFDHPFLVKSIDSQDLSANQILVAVPKKYLRKAVKRNKIKRRIRESYRLNKHLFSAKNHKYIAFIYLSKEELSFQKIEGKLKNILIRLSTSIKEGKENEEKS